MSDSWDNLDLDLDLTPRKDIDCNKNLLSHTNLNKKFVTILQTSVENNVRSVNADASVFASNSINSIKLIEEEHFIDEDEVEQLLSDVHMNEINIKMKEKEKEIEIKPIQQFEQKDKNEKKQHVESVKILKELELIDKSVINNKQETSRDSSSNKYKNYFKNMKERVINAYDTTRNKILEYQFPNKIKEIFSQNKCQIMYFMIGSLIVGLNISIIFNQYKILNDRVNNLEREMCYRQYRPCEHYYYIFYK
jgi:hypothetical protein